MKSQTVRLGFAIGTGEPDEDNLRSPTGWALMTATRGLNGATPSGASGGQREVKVKSLAALCGGKSKEW